MPSFLVLLGSLVAFLCLSQVITPVTCVTGRAGRYFEQVPGSSGAEAEAGLMEGGEGREGHRGSPHLPPEGVVSAKRPRPLPSPPVFYECGRNGLF